MAWRDLPRYALQHLGNVISLTLYRRPPFQVEMILMPDPSALPKDGFTAHKHPNVDSYEFHLTGEIDLAINGKSILTPEQIQEWLDGKLQTVPVRINHTDWHCGRVKSPVAFLSIQKWLNGVEPTTVGFDWEGETTHACQEPYAVKRGR